MAEKYSLDRKIERILKADYGIDATCANLLVTAGDYSEQMSGVIHRDKLRDFAERVKAAQGNG